MNTKGCCQFSLVLSLLLFLGGMIVHAQDVSRIRIQTNFSILCKKSKPSDSEMADALIQAKKEILKRYFEQSNTARRQVLEPINGNIESSVHSIVSEVQIVAQDFDKSSKTLTLSVIGYVNEGAINLMLPHEVGSKNYLSLIFVARRQVSVKTLGPEVITGTTKDDATTQQTSQENNGCEHTAQATIKTDSAIISKSAVTQNSDRITYAVSASDSLDVAMEGALTERNFKVVPSATVRRRSDGAFAVEKFLESFKMGSDVDPELIQNAAEACVNMIPKLPFYGFGTLTLEPPQRDPVSGRIRVNVQVYAKVIDCREDFVTTAASIEAIQYLGLGESATEAETVAITGAAKLAARLIADKLNAKGIF